MTLTMVVDLSSPPRRRLRPAFAPVLVLSAAFLSLVGCKKDPPQGDVVAIVNDQDVTSQDLQAEARAEKLPDDPETAKTLLDRVTSRLLLAQYAHREKLDSYAGYANDLARLNQALLAELALQKLITPAPAPSDAAVKRFVDAHSLLFAHRVGFEIDEIVAEGRLARTIRLEPNMHLIAGKLSDMGASFRRRRLTTDTSVLSDDLSKKLLALKPGGILFVDEPAQTLAMNVLSRHPVEMTAEAQMAEARQLISRQAADRHVEEAIKTLRAAASIAYQPGYAPPAVRPTS